METNTNKEDVTFINAFQRPCSSKYEDIDREVVLKVIKIIQPSFICFVSKKAFYLLGENLQNRLLSILAVINDPSLSKL